MNAVPRTFRGWCSILLLMQAVAVIGCASKAYRYGEFWKEDDYQVVIDYGQPNKRLDRLSDIVTWPGRKLMPERPDKRKITPETTAKVTEYLAKNDITDVYVSVRDYDPRDQWRRLRENQLVPPLSRYTFGALSLARYSILPGRVFGGNAYNPFTNTLYVNSDSPALLLHEAAFAKNVRSQRSPGIYAASSEIPFVSLWQEFDSARDVVGYAKAEGDWQLEQESYREVFPHVGSEAGGGVSTFVTVWWGGPLLGLAGTAAGTVAGRTALAQREKSRDSEMDLLVESEVTGRVQQVSFEEPVGDEAEPAKAFKKSTAQTPRGRRIVGKPRERQAVDLDGEDSTAPESLRGSKEP